MSKTTKTVTEKPTQKPMIEDVLIPNEHGVIQAQVAWQPTQKDGTTTNTVALVCHPHPLYGGTMDNKVVTTVARDCIAKGMHTIRFNFRGVGKSTGTHDLGIGETTDAQTVLNWFLAQAHQKGLSVTHLWLAGFSFGGYIASNLATSIATNPEDTSLISVRKLTLIAPAVGQIDDRQYNVDNLVLPKNTHVIYGNIDEVVPPEAMRQFAEQYKLNQTIIADASHFFHGKLTELRKFL